MKNGEVVLLPTIGKVFSEVIRTGVPGLVPLENSEAGGVTATLDCLMVSPVIITLEAFLPVHHCLASAVPQDEITHIYAHPQSHEQCSRVIEDLNLPVIHTESNATSALSQKSNPGSGAIISESLATRHMIPVIQKNIENNEVNITRFIKIERDPGIGIMENTGYEKCSLLIDPDEDRAGLLYDLLTPFKQNAVNLTRIESRPSKRSMGRYVFFLDLNCEGGWREAIEELSRLTRFKYLGCYSRLELT